MMILHRKNKKFCDFSQIVSADALLTTFHEKEYKDFTLKKSAKKMLKKHLDRVINLYGSRRNMESISPLWNL